MVRLLRVLSPAPGVCEHWLLVPAKCTGILASPGARDRVVGSKRICILHFVCVFPCNLRGYSVSLLIELMAGKNVSPSDKQAWRFLEKNFVAEKWSCTR